MVTKAKRTEYLLRLKSISAKPRDIKIYRKKFGLDDGILRSNAVTGKSFKITGEAVRQAINRISSQIGFPTE